MDDPILNALVAFTLSVRGQSPPDRVLAAAELRVLDALGCALAGLDAPAVAAAGRAVGGSHGRARLWGSLDVAAVADAGFVNSIAIRCLDFNDTGGGHPSDVLGVLMALAETEGSSGRDLLEAMAISYECQLSLWDLLSPEKAGVDQGVCAAIGTAAASAHLMRLDRAATANAISLAAVSGVPLYAVRAGELSTWKAGAAPWAARQGYLAARLAAAEFTGPPCPFVGVGGLADLVGQPPSAERFTLPAKPKWAVERSNVKWWPVRFSCQIMIDAAIQARGAGLASADIARVRVVTYAAARDYFERSPDLRLPQNRETADHSLSFCVAAALLDGTVDPAAFERERFLDADVVAVIERMVVDVDDDWTDTSNEQLNCRVEVAGVDGSQVTGTSCFAFDGTGGPADGDEVVVAKFERLCATITDSGQRAAIEKTCLDLRHLDDVRDLIDLLHR